MRVLGGWYMLTQTRWPREQKEKPFLGGAGFSQDMAGRIDPETDIQSNARGLGVDRKCVPIFTVKQLVRACAQKVMGTGELKRGSKGMGEGRDQEQGYELVGSVRAGKVDTVCNFWS